MKILGIETSCDETATAIVENGKKILSSITTSSEELQKKFGGIIPEQAAREQLKYIIPVIDQVSQKAKLKLENIDALAVTYGPGLIGSLIVGLETAKTLSFVLKKPLIPVHHLLSHIYANFLNQDRTISLPAICLIVSGGHTDLLLMSQKHTFKWLGGTRDDAAGECFDKTARMIGLNYPGGPAIEQAAQQLPTPNHKLKIKLPRPIIATNDFDFSFSGLKTAVLTLTQKRNQFKNLTSQQFASLLAYEIQEAITDVLVVKTLKATQKYKTKSILIGGGVAANKQLRKKFTQVCKTHFCKNTKVKKVALFIPSPKFCTDNAAITATTAYYQNRPVDWHNLKPEPSLHF